MHHVDILKTATSTLTERGKDYGDAAVNFDNIARIAGIVLNRVVTPYEVAIFHIATKLARSSTSPGKEDNWIDLVNYAAFAGQFSQHISVPRGGDPVDNEIARIVDIVRAPSK